ncbi:MAG: ABC transporter ATP-binding protein [Petrimonas sp.]|nr:ABC transporter ATP-binding protein [Petrimonas sp.]
MSFLQLQQVSVGYFEKKQPVFVQQALNLSAQQGELVALIGTNGCGKSTLLRSIACLQPLLSGKIVVDNKNITEITPKQRARLISVVLTENMQVASFTVRELISIGRDPYTGWLGSLSSEDQETIDRAIAMTNLQGFGERNIHELSDGERQRVFIARALAQDTPVILLDEPTSHLDLPNRINTLLLLQKLARETGKIILISTHELETAMQVADKIWLMRKQHGVIVGTPEDMVLNGDFDTVFKHNSYEFDKEYGSFVVQKQLERIVKTSVKNPNGLMARWTTKALSRKGYKITSEAPVEVVVDEENKSWKVKHDEVVSEEKDIDGMLQKIADFYSLQPLTQD